MRFLALVLALFLSASADAQLFRWGAKSQVSSSCPGGVCPTSQYNYRPVASAAFQPFKSVANRGHWSYPGDITSHLEGTHGVATAGMTREQKLNYHDSLHEGTASRYRSVSGTTGYGSAGVGYGSTGGVNYGSAGGFSVGSRDKDGHVIASIGPVQPVAMSAEAVEMRGSTTMSERVKFRRSFLEAARNARKAGDIDAGQFFMLSAMSRNPATLEKIMGAVHEAAIEEGMASVSAIDWDSLILFIEKLLPLILQLIDLFSFNQPFAIETPQYVQVTTCDWSGLAA